MDAVIDCFVPTNLIPISYLVPFDFTPLNLQPYLIRISSPFKLSYRKGDNSPPRHRINGRLDHGSNAGLDVASFGLLGVDDVPDGGEVLRGTLQISVRFEMSVPESNENEQSRKYEWKANIDG